MTFAIAISVASGVVALADTRVVRGEQHSTKTKMSTIRHGSGAVVVMTSGLRSVRDKTLLRLEDQLASMDAPFVRLHELATAYGTTLRQVREEDAEALASSGLSFDAHTILAGQLDGDAQPELFHVYPEGNWIVATPDVPYFVVGRTTYCKPILDRLVRSDMPLRSAVGLAYLAFDATHASVVDVDFPIDVVTVTAGRYRRRRFDADDLDATRRFWHDRLTTALDELPDSWALDLLSGDQPTMTDTNEDP